MSNQILRIDSSVFGAAGVSTQLTQHLVDQLAQANDVQVVHRDLAQDPLPHFSAEIIYALGAAETERSDEQRALVKLADELIAQVQNADILVVGAPMYNFGVPSNLKAWLDFIARAGVTFRYTDKGPQGLLLNKTLYIATSRGGIYKDQPSDLMVPYLQMFFNFLGVTDIRVIYAEGINMGQKEQSIRAAKEAIAEVVAQPTAA